jgi:hypothetical protein
MVDHDTFPEIFLGSFCDRLQAAFEGDLWAKRGRVVVSAGQNAHSVVM